MRRFGRNLLLLISVLLCSSCKVDLGLEDAASKVKTGMSDLSTGLKEIDPIAAQKMFNQNEELRNQLKVALQKADAYANPGGYIVLNGTKIKLKIIEYVGKFKIDVWNNDEQVVSDYPLIDHPLRLKDKRVDFINWKYPSLRPYHGETLDFVMRLDSQNYAQWALEQFVASDGPLSSDDKNDLTLNYTFGAEGIKSIRVSITPLPIDGLKSWSIKGAIIAQYANGSEDRIVAFGQDGERFGQPEDVAKFHLHIKAVSQGSPTTLGPNFIK